MAKKNRHLRGDINDITLPVHGNIVVEKGELPWVYALSRNK